ncbi:MAG: methionyl-tRNA formyltransferase [Lachnospira sp.]
MKVVFMGTPDFSVETLKKIIEAGHEVVAVVTQPDKPKGRSGALCFSPVKEEAVSKGLTVLQPERARNPEFIETLRSYDADVFVVVAFGQILPKEIIDMPPFGCINVHASLLPKYRGASPIQWAVIDGCEYSGVTTMKMDEGIDTGDILLVEKVKLDEKETGGSLFDKLSIVGADLLVETLKRLEEGTITPVKQNDAESTHVKMIPKSLGNIDFSMEASRIEHLIRGLNPWPSAFTTIAGKMLKIWDADVLDENRVLSLFRDSIASENMNQFGAGTVVYFDKETFVVKCGQDYLKINEVQMEGKKRMTSDSFLRGFHMETGMVLGK